MSFFFKYYERIRILHFMSNIYSGVSNTSVGANNSVGRHNFPKFNNSVGDLLTK